MDTFLRELYDGKPRPGSEAKHPRCDWLDIQDVAFDDSKDAHNLVKKIVLKAQKASVKLPIIRKATEPFTYKRADGKLETIATGSTVVCDIVRQPTRIYCSFTDMSKKTEQGREGRQIRQR